MTTVRPDRARIRALAEKLLPGMQRRAQQLGVNLAIYDADGSPMAPMRIEAPFCVASGCRGTAHCGELSSLARRCLADSTPTWGRLETGCQALAVPVYQRRRLLAALVATYPVVEMLGPEPPAVVQPGCAYRPETVTRSALSVEDLAAALGYMLEAEQTVTASKTEIESMSANLGSTYEELSLLYTISGQMKVSQPPRRFFAGVCAELREVMGVAAAVAVIHAHPGSQNQEVVVIDGDLDLNDPQLRLLVSSQIVPQLDPSAPLIDNDFRPDPASGIRRAFRHVIAAPLIRDRRPMGVLMGLDKLANPEEGFDTVDVKLITSVANQASVFLANNRLYAELQELLLGVLHALTASVDAKDPYTCGHSQRVAAMSRILAEEMGLEANDVQQVYLSGLLHDVGKIGVSESVLCKPGRLTDEEYLNMKRHPAIGSKILSGIRQLEGVVAGILTHHERPDGRGYPQGLEGEEIPMQGRIVGLADVFDAMTSDRTYRKALPLEKAVEEIRRYAGAQFDAEVVETFLRLDVEELWQRLRQPVQTVFPVSFLQELSQ
mgnify:CR=1 FL=1